MCQKVLIAMSGGVDSSVTARLLKEKGYNCSGAIMQLCTDEGVNDAKAVAESVNIPFYAIDKKADFRSQIIDGFAKDYFAGLTPNPCIECNKKMKFGAFLDEAMQNGFDYIATGHYARIRYNEESSKYELLKAEDLSKDQSYVLYFLNQHQLAHILLPLGDYTKAEIRAFAENYGFVNAKKKDSQDICFVPDGDYASVIEKVSGRRSECGNFIDISGNVLGRHNGIVNYTIGQRKGLGIALGKPQFVISKNPCDNTVVLSDEEHLFYKKVMVKDVNFISGEDIKEPIMAEVKLRYSMQPQPATLFKAEDGVIIEFQQPQRAPSPGQAAVFYQGDLLLGGGTIVKGLKEN